MHTPEQMRKKDEARKEAEYHMKNSTVDGQNKESPNVYAEEIKDNQ